MEHRKKATPSNLKVNKSAFNFAKNLIEQGKIDCTSQWGKHAPIADSEDRFLKNHTMQEYGTWFLATTEGTNNRIKAHYEFPLGDFNVIYREGVIMAKKRAAQYKHELVEKAADALLSILDKTCKI